MSIPGFKSSDALIGYCRIHATTQRALFSGIQIKEMYRLAGEEVPEIPDDTWCTLKEEMLNLCDLALKRLSDSRSF